MRHTRKVHAQDLRRIDEAIAQLKEARFNLRHAQAFQSYKKVCSAIKSAEGARRHTEGLLTRQTKAEQIEAGITDEQIAEYQAILDRRTR